jgi:hypothetical protein
MPHPPATELFQVHFYNLANFSLRDLERLPWEIGKEHEWSRNFGLPARVAVRVFDRSQNPIIVITILKWPIGLP